MNYRDNIYDKGEELLSRLGTFWYYIFGSGEELKQMYRGSALEAGQTYLNFLESVGTISRLDTPVFHRQDWLYITMLESEVTSGVINYGDGVSYGEGYRYGTRTTRKRFEVAVPDGFVGSSQIFNRIIQPSLTYTEGIDYVYDKKDKVIVFTSNPFENNLVPTRNIVDENGNVVDRLAALWAYNGKLDLQYLWNHWGYALKAYMPSSEFYKSFINALADCYTECPTLEDIQLLISALTGVALVAEPVETVEKILVYADKKQVVTDKHVYTFDTLAEIVVTEGQVVNGGDPLTDAVKVIELEDSFPTISELPALVAGPEFIAGDYFSDLMFENKDVPLEYVGVDTNNKAVVKFDVSGFPEDVAAFWGSVHDKGLQAGKVLSNYLDTRTSKTDPVPAWALPATVNPMQIMLGNLMRNNIFIVVLKPAHFNDEAPGIQFFNYLRRALTPQTTYIVYVEVATGVEYIDLSGPDGLVEELSFLQIPEGVEDVIDESFITEATMTLPIKDC